MTVQERTALEAMLDRHDGPAWRSAVDNLVPEVHEVDRAATRIWFAFWPLRLHRVLRDMPDRARLVFDLGLLGRFELKDHVDTSHRFFYGHRWWPEVKAAVEALADGPAGDLPPDLAGVVRAVARGAAGRAGVAVDLVLGLAAAGLMTLQQVGFAAFRAARGTVLLDPVIVRRSPEAVLQARAKDDSQGLLGFLRGERKIWTVTFDENDPAAHYPLVHTQDLTTAAANDTRDYRSGDPRCQDGPIPVQCRAASCGTCWVGVLGGAEKLSPVEPLERRRIREFGYITTDEPRPLIRLACQARATGAVSIAIPPWNGCFGRALPE